MTFEMLDHTYNAIFIVPLVVGFLLILFQMMGFSLGKVLSGVETDGDAHVDGDVHADADADADADAHVDGDGLHHGLEAHAGAGGALFHALSFFNIGRVPFMVVLECLMLTFGGLGISMTALLGEHLGGGAVLVLAASVPVALVGSVATTKCLSAFFARYLPTLETTALSGHALVGLAGEVVSPRLDARGGGAATWRIGSGPATRSTVGRPRARPPWPRGIGSCSCATTESSGSISAPGTRARPRRRGSERPCGK
ncbi:MAG: DUF1449 family protein [Planctomycetes bacterium]|nr:DUF1449 family protein [Planctomycetota bacterium]